MANLLLGLPDERIPAGYVTSWDINKIGGSPDWMSSPPPPTVCKLCGRKQVFLLQLYCPLTDQQYHRTIYVFACIAATCKNKSESWTVLRCQQLDPTYGIQEAPQAAGGVTAGATDSWGTDNWGMDADDWGDADDFPALEESSRSTDSTIGNVESTVENAACTKESSSSTEENMNSVESVDNVRNGAPWTGDKQENTPEIPPNTESSTLADATATLEAMSIDDGTSNELIAEDLGIIPDESILCKMLQPSHSDMEGNSELEIPGHFVAVVEEEPEKESYRYEAKLLQEYSQKEGVNIQELQEEAFMSSKKGRKGKGGGGGDGQYVKAVAKHGDQIFAKFSKKISTCPQQILRYCHEGEALHISAAQQAPVPPCTSCGCDRKYEFQLMPTMVPLFRSAGSEEPVVEFGTVLVYTCSSSCWDDKGYRTEYAVVEADPDKEKFAELGKRLGLKF